MEIGCWLKGRKMTNFEKIRQLSEEEMAKYIFDLEMGLREIPYCQGNDRCSYLMDSLFNGFWPRDPGIHVYRMRKKVAATGRC